MIRLIYLRKFFDPETNRLDGENDDVRDFWIGPTVR